MELNQEKIIENILSLPCPSCGGKVTYSAEEESILCAYCGYKEEVNSDNDQVQETSLKEAIKEKASFVPEQTGKKVFDCGGCGAKFMIESDKIAVNCGFCGSENVNEEAFEHRFIKPVGIIPFKIAKEQASNLFKKWIKQGWFHPNKLKTLAAIDSLHGIYIPFWTYDAYTQNQWSGDAGYYYYETKQVHVNGKWETRQIQKVRWRRQQGSFNHFFDDVLVVASKGLPQARMQQIMPFRLAEVVNYDGRLMLGWEAEIYSLEVDDGYHIADQIMDRQLRGMASAKLGGDTQRNLRVQTDKFEQQFKHIILPVWICAYQYNNKVYQFAVNGQTGKVNGQKPLSWIKITFAVLLFVGFIALIYFLRESGVFEQ